jgi:membrane protease YdiL (CAAX protease family)
MTEQSYRSVWLTVLLSCMGTFGFAWFIPAPPPFKTIAVVGLLIPVWFLVKVNPNFRSLFQSLGLTYKKATLKFLILGAGIGLAVSLFYRWHLGVSYKMGPLTGFAFVAASIGISEELLFRGFIQGQLEKVDRFWSVPVSSLGHTLYKAILFITPFANTTVDIAFLAFWTFSFGLLFGWLRNRSGSVLPAVLAHALFDIWIYGHLNKIPWWVW